MASGRLTLRLRWRERTGSTRFTATSRLASKQSIHASTPPPRNDLDRTYFNANSADVGLLASSVRQQDVLGFQVAVDDAFAVEDAHGRGYLLEENPQRVLPQRPFS